MMSQDETKSQLFPDVGEFKKICRLLELKRRNFLLTDWVRYEDILSQSQFVKLMHIRFALPCNLSRIMALTGLTSAGASIFVDKLVTRGILCRVDDPVDRRNVSISATPQGVELLQSVEKRLNEYVLSYFQNCTPEELSVLTRGLDVIIAHIGNDEE